MKFRTLLLVVVLGSSACPPCVAQAASGKAADRLSYLSVGDRRHLLRVRRQVLAENPDLKSETESLQKERAYVKGEGTEASAQDRETLLNNVLAHGEKMDAAMRKDDPTVGPILDQVKAHRAERLQQRQGQEGASGTGDTGAGSSTSDDNSSN
jgi:hypothetical protein